jgi:quercetin dioxygenase-like cupin family protein
MSELHATKVVRLYAGDFGESRFESLTIPMSHKEFAPPAAPVHVTEPRPAQHFVVIELPVGWGGTEPHPTPGRHMAFCLSGSFRMTTSSGETRLIQAGDCVLMEDTSGKGHVTEVTSDKPVKAVYRTRFFGHKFELSGLLHSGFLPGDTCVVRTA